MRFFLFILANAMLFIRPSEFVPELGEFELYRYVIALCALVSFPVILHQLFARCASVPPIAGCVLGLLPAVLLSHLSHGNGEEAYEQGMEFFKVLVYFLLFLGLVTTTTRLRQFLFWLGLLCGALALIAVLRYHASLVAPPPPPPSTEKMAEMDAKEKKKIMHGQSVKEQYLNPETGELEDVLRMCGTGIFNDPNDLALALVTAIPLALYFLTDPKRKGLRPLWLALILLFGYALLLTHSRGGLIALMAGLLVLFYLRFGTAKTAMLGMVFLPPLLAIFAGRMTQISASEGTGQSRIQLWSDGLTFFQQAPLFGIGMDGYTTISSHVAHNSYIHSYVELGMFGGTLFVGAFYFALQGLFRLKHSPKADADAAANVSDGAAGPDADPELHRMHPFLMAMLVCYAVGIAFLSRNYIVPTYLLLALAVVYMRLRATGTSVSWGKLIPLRLVGVSCGFLIVAYTVVRLFVNWG